VRILNLIVERGDISRASEGRKHKELENRYQATTNEE
jgi:hypothetical protein